MPQCPDCKHRFPEPDGGMECPKCGSRPGDDKAECTSCAEKIAMEDAEFCRRCNDSLCVDCAYEIDDDPYCPYCYDEQEAKAIDMLREGAG